MSCVRRSMNSAAVTSLSAGPFGSVGCVAGAPVPQVGFRTGPADTRVRGYAPRLSLLYSRIACPIWRRLLAHPTRADDSWVDRLVGRKNEIASTITTNTTSSSTQVNPLRDPRGAQRGRLRL